MKSIIMFVMTLILIAGLLHHGRVVCETELSPQALKTTFSEQELSLFSSINDLLVKKVCRVELRK